MGMTGGRLIGILWSLLLHVVSAWSSPQQRRRQLTSRTASRGSSTGGRHAEVLLSAASFGTIRREPRGKAFAQQTPHSGRHFVPSHPAYRRRRCFRRRGRFMEGWYYRLTTPEGSFALIVSIEDAGNRRSDLNLACIQIVGPADSYLVQADTDDTKFWAWKHQQGLGCRFASRSKAPSLPASATALDADDWKDQVGSGFQILPNHFLGKIDGHDGSLGGVLPSQGIPGKCNFDFTVAPRCGWGDADQPRQKSTGGWLSFFAIFEPHWQVTLADGCATGSIEWQNRTIHFTDAPFYAEKNWGAALPSKWYWTQCNSFPGYNQLSVTAGGGIRRLPLGGKEALGMVCVHFNDKFYQAVPWTGTMTWKVETWGYWEMYGRSEGDRPFEVEIILTADPVTTPGLVFRAPTPDEGMVYFCRDTFEAQTTLSLWELVWDSRSKSHVRKPGPPLIDRATSGEGGAEVGGGPWWDTWTANSQSQVSKPVIFLLRLPLRAQRLRDSLLRKQQPS